MASLQSDSSKLQISNTCEMQSLHAQKYHLIFGQDFLANYEIFTNFNNN